MGILNEGNGSGFYMPVAPAYGGGYGNGGGLFGGDGGIWGLLLVLLLCGNGMWGGFGGMGGMFPWMMGGMGAGFGMDYLYPWLNNSQHMSDGFRDQNLQNSVTGLQNSVTAGFGDVQLGLAGVNQNICQTGNAITGAVRDGFYTAEIGANNRQMANMQQLFGVQTAITDGTCKQLASAADLKYTIANEGCADRAALSTAVNSLLTHIDQKVQGVQDKLCQLEMDGYKRENQNLRDQLNMATLRESQTAQNAFIAQGFSDEVDALYNRLNNCPVPSTPVYGRTPIFTCQQGGCGCGAYAA